MKGYYFPYTKPFLVNIHLFSRNLLFYRHQKNGQLIQPRYLIHFLKHYVFSLICMTPLGVKRTLSLQAVVLFQNRPFGDSPFKFLGSSLISPNIGNGLRMCYSVVLSILHQLDGLPLHEIFYDEVIPSASELTDEDDKGRFLPKCYEYLFAAYLS